MIDFLAHVDNSWTLFLDRDGVINRRIVGGYVAHPRDFEFLPGVLDALKIFSARFGKIIIVTNQQGVGKGIMTDNQIHEVHKYMLTQVTAAGARIDGIYFCGDLETKPHNCRKPNIHMAVQAKNRFPEIDFSKSIMVGDSHSDMEFGTNAGMKTIFVSSEPIASGVGISGVVSGLWEFAQRLQQQGG